MTRVFNFSAGPAVLPEPVLRRAAEEMLDWHGSGMSVMEMSHRGKEFISIAENAVVPLNLLGGRESADYVNTGEWSKKSIKEARKYAKVNVAASAEDRD